MTMGMNTGPRPMAVMPNPIALLRLSRKYVLIAKFKADNSRLNPIAEIGLSCVIFQVVTEWLSDCFVDDPTS